VQLETAYHWLQSAYVILDGKIICADRGHEKILSGQKRDLLELMRCLTYFALKNPGRGL